MSNNENYGIILKVIREQSRMSVRNFAQKIGRSSGWLSEVENEKGTARIKTEDFDYIVSTLGLDKQRSQFRTWVANYRNTQKIDRAYEGAVLKHIRLRRKIKLNEVSLKSGLSIKEISLIENGKREPTLATRNSILKACGYSPASFKNFATDPVRSKAVPAELKLRILIKRLSEREISQLFEFGEQLCGRRPA